MSPHLAGILLSLVAAAAEGQSQSPSLDTTVFAVTGAGEVTCSGGAGVTSNPDLCLRSGTPRTVSAAILNTKLAAGITVEAVSFEYAYETGYSGTSGAAFNLTVGGYLVYASPQLDDHPYSKSHPAYGTPIKVTKTGVGVAVQANNVDVTLEFANYERNLQLLLPLRINVTCSGAVAGSEGCAAPPAPPPPPPPYPPLTTPPEVYFASSPTMPGETVLVGGAGLDGAAATLCSGTGCRPPAAPVASWNQSVKAVLPATCGPPCTLKLSAAGGGADIVVNQPDVWFAMSNTPAASPAAANTTHVTATLTAGELLRAFGRSLAWTAGGGACIDGRGAPQANTGTTLSLTPRTLRKARADGGVAAAEVKAETASCYEASFATAGIAPGAYRARLATIWGESSAFDVDLLPSMPPSPPSVLDVDSDFGGSLAAALQKAAALPAPSRARVVLGPHLYQLDIPFAVPDRTAIVGAGQGITELAFTVTTSSPRGGAIFEMGNNASLEAFTLNVTAATNRSFLTVVDIGRSGATVSGLRIVLEQASAGPAFQVQARGFELIGNTIEQLGACDARNPARILLMHRASVGRIANNTARWLCAAFGADVSDQIIFEDNVWQSTDLDKIIGGNYIASYDLYHHASSRLWSIQRNAFSRPLKTTADSWQFHETLTTDAPHSYNMGVVTATEDGGRAVHLTSRMFPPAGATLVILGGPGAGQTRVVTGRSSSGAYVIDRPFDGWMAPNISMVASLPTVGRKLVVGNRFVGASVVQWFGDTLHGVHADNDFVGCNARAGIGGVMLGGALQVGALCYKGAPGQVFFTEYLGNTMNDSDGIALVDNWQNTQLNDCGARGQWPGPWIQWAVVRNNSFAGVSLRATFDANKSGTVPQCGSLIQRAEKGFNTTDLVAEGQHFACPPGMAPGGNDVQGCDHCSIIV